MQIIGGPSWDQLRDGTMVTLRRLLNPRCIVKENKVEHRWDLSCGSSWMFRTLDDPDVLRALEAHDLWIDEIAMCNPDALDIAMPRISLGYDDPTFENSLWGTTTPRGEDFTLDVWGWEGKPELGYEVYHSTIYDNEAHLPAGLIPTLEDRYRDTPFFEQELLGKYTAFEGLVYPMFHPDKHVKESPWALRDSERVVVGVDFGGTADPSAMVLVGFRHNRYHQFEEFYKVGATLPEMLERLEAWTAAAGRRRAAMLVRCDPSGTVLTTTIGAAGYACAPAERDKLAGIEVVAARLTGSAGMPQFTLSPGCSYTRTEFRQYVWSKKRDGSTNVVYFTSTPIDHHADAMDAIRYALMGLAQTQPSRPVKLAGGMVIRGR